MKTLNQVSKKVEYRKHGARWNQATCETGRQVTLSKGYGKQNRLTGEILAFQTCKAFELDPHVRKGLEMIYKTLDFEIACIYIEVKKINILKVNS